MAASPQLRDRADIPERFKWNLAHIFPDWDAWKAAYDELETKVQAFAAMRGTLAQGPDRLLASYVLRDAIGQLEYKVWYFASLRHDEDQRDNDINARRQQVQILFSKEAQASAWFDPELLSIPLSTVQEWMASSPKLALYRFVEDLYRQQEHVLDDKGERLLSLSSRFSSTPYDAYAALSTADIKHPSIRLTSGAEVTLTYGQYRAILATNRDQRDRAAAFTEYHKLFEANVNTYASLYNGVLQRDWFHSQSRGYKSTLEAALHGNNIPTSVVRNLIETTKAGTEPLRRYHRLRKRVLGLETYHSYDATIPLLDFDEKYPYEHVLEWLPASVAPLGPDYQRQLRDVLAGDWIDVYENPGQAQRRLLGAGVRRASVHAAELQRHAGCRVHAGARDGAFDAHAAVARASAVRLLGVHDFRRRSAVHLERGALPRVHAGARRASASGSCCSSTRSTASCRRSTPRCSLRISSCRRTHARGRGPAGHGGEARRDLPQPRAGVPRRRDRPRRGGAPHVGAHPAFLQHAVLRLPVRHVFCVERAADEGADERRSADRAAAIDRYLTLLKSGGSDHPMPLLKRAGVDLSKPETVRAVVDQLDTLVTKLEDAIAAVP